MAKKRLAPGKAEYLARVGRWLKLTPAELESILLAHRVLGLPRARTLRSYSAAPTTAPDWFRDAWRLSVMRRRELDAQQRGTAAPPAPGPTPEQRRLAALGVHVPGLVLASKTPRGTTATRNAVRHDEPDDNPTVQRKRSIAGATPHPPIPRGRPRRDDPYDDRGLSIGPKEVRGARPSRTPTMPRTPQVLHQCHVCLRNVGATGSELSKHKNRGTGTWCEGGGRPLGRVGAVAAGHAATPERDSALRDAVEVLAWLDGTPQTERDDHFGADAVDKLAAALRTVVSSLAKVDVI